MYFVKPKGDDSGFARPMINLDLVKDFSKCDDCRIRFIYPPGHARYWKFETAEERDKVYDKLVKKTVKEI